MFVIGTAGHVDHGKSTLVKALTGIDPDRLAEEKAREMTIDLGFAWLSLGEGELAEVGVVDVPGHRDFIENMLAGVGGIDLALFVVAADEGVMPQTQEHLAILDLLKVPGGVVAVTKSDLVVEPDWLELVMLDLGETLAGTVLEDAPMIPVSARTGAGLDQLLGALRNALSVTAPRPDLGRPRLPIDRVFTLSGFGAVVTGTLTGGSLTIGDAVEIQPTGLKARIRGLQTHRTKVQVARPGSRVAINLSGVETRQLQRGEVVATPGVVRATVLIDVQYNHLADAQRALEHNDEVKLFSGSAEVIARARILGAQQIDPGTGGWLQLKLAEPMALARGDRFILRRPSPAATIGGGRVLDPHPGRQHRRFRPETISRMRTLAEGGPEERLLQALAGIEPAALAKLLAGSGMEPAAAHAAWHRLLAEGQVRLLPGDQAITGGTWKRLQSSARYILESYHQQYPLRGGMAREALRGQLRVSAVVFNPLLAELREQGVIDDTGGIARLAGYQITLNDQQQAMTTDLIARMATAGINSPSVKECKEELGEELFFALIEMGKLCQVSGDVVYTAQSYAEIREQILGYLDRAGKVNVAGLRDLFDTSRKYAIAWLEHFDEQRITRRVGDDRVPF